MNRIKQLMEENRKYGFKEVKAHVAGYFAISPVNRAKYNSISSQEKARYLKALSEEQKKSEIIEHYLKVTGEILDLNNLHTFNEKIQWLKLYDDTDEKTRLADKYLVREWIKDEIGEQYLVPLVGAWDNPEQIDYHALPDKFCLKANHGSGMNIVVKDKNKLDKEYANRLMSFWLKTEFGADTLEFQYLRIPKKIIAEQYIEQQDGNLMDYKIHCFHGIPKIIQVIGNRNFSTHSGYEAFFDTEWRRNDHMYHTYEQYAEAPQKPNELGKLLELASILSKGFKYVRTDFYVVDGSIKFGEMTFTPFSGYGKWESQKENELVGSWIKI